MANKKVTGKKAASNASKTAAGSALSQREAPKKKTYSKAATPASNLIQSSQTGKAYKSAAGSALSQKSSRKKVVTQGTNSTGPKAKK